MEHCLQNVGNYLPIKLHDVTFPETIILKTTIVRPQTSKLFISQD